jgi:spore germination cell wall hydrolase CwlJ-like protein
MKYITTILLVIVVIFAYLLISANEKIVSSNVINVPYQYLSAKEKKEVDCLADNIYYEAGYEPKEGRIAVAAVTLNRVKSQQFNDTVCGVVKQKIRNTCQFTWLCDGSANRKPNENKYNEAVELALYVYFNHGIIEDPSKGALYYHADYVNPQWKLDRTTVIGRHIFYKPKEENVYARKIKY